MSPALWGTLGALSWGTSDFLARFSSRAVGHVSALLGMLTTGSVILSLWLWWAEVPIQGDTSSLWLLALGGVGAMLATMLLYQGLARGPVTIVAPIVAGYPALVVAIHYLLGARPGPVQWLAMLATIAGVVVVARCARSFEEPGAMERRALRTTVLIALGSSFGFAVTVAASQVAVPIFGAMQTVWATRLISLGSLLVLLVLRRERPNLATRWWPVLGLQGVLDSGGYVALFLGSTGEDAAFAAVTCSAFAVVTVLLARLFLREAMTWQQWAGIVLVFTGVAVLAAPV